MTQKKILFLTTQLPYPPKSGGTVKSWNYVNFLAKKYQLSVASLLKENDESHINDFEKKIRLEALFTTKVNIKRSALNLLLSYFFAPSLNVFRNHSEIFRKAVNRLSSQNDIIIVDHYEMFQYVPKTFKGKVVLHTHNAEFMLWKRMAELERRKLIKKIILWIEAYRVKTYEKKIFSQSDLIYSTPSDIDLYEIYGFHTSKHSLTYHLGNDDLLDLPNINFENTEKCLMFMGTLSWEPNIDGLCWFINEVWPSIKRKHLDCKLYVLGKSPDSRIIKAANNDSSIVFTGFIKELESYLKKTRVYIAPLRFGSGMKVKVLEGLYRGVPTVSTSIGAEGLAVSSTKEIMISDEAKSFSEQCIRLLEDKKLWNQLRDNSRKVASEKYRWKPLFELMDRRLQELD